MQRPRLQRVLPYVPFHIRTTLSRRLVGTHRFSPVLDLALSPCECKYSSPAVTAPRSATGHSLGAGGWPDQRLLGQVPRIRGARESQRHRHDDRFGVTISAVRPIANVPAERADSRGSSSRARSATNSSGCIWGCPSQSELSTKLPQRSPPRTAKKRRAVACSALFPCDRMPNEPASAHSGSEDCADSDHSQILTAVSLREG